MSATLNKKLRRRVLAGEGKTAIYGDFAGTPIEKRAANLLAMIAIPENRKKYSALNKVFLALACIIIFTMFHSVFSMPARARAVGMELTPVYACVAMTYVVFFMVIYFITTYNVIGYLMVFVFGFTWIFNTMKKIAFGENHVFITKFILTDVAFGICLLAGMILSVVLFRKLFPSLGFFMNIKRDTNGKPIFET